LYIKEVKTTPEIVATLKCSREVVRKKCIEFGIPLRNPGSKRKKINETTLRKLYVKEGKNLAEVARIVVCSYSVIQKRVVLLGLNKDTRTNHKGRNNKWLSIPSTSTCGDHSFNLIVPSKNCLRLLLKQTTCPLPSAL
jgi:hypothetical protein